MRPNGYSAGRGAAAGGRRGSAASWMGLWLAFGTCVLSEVMAGEVIPVGTPVTQKRGVVCTTDDFQIYKDKKGLADHCWVLSSETAIGEVEKIDRTHLEVRFDSAEGWTKQIGAARNTYTFLRDYWGNVVLVVESRDRVGFDKDDNGLLLTGENADGSLVLPIRVRFPIHCVSVPPPVFGDLVRRGPHWNKGSADGGQPDAVGRIILRSPEDTEVRGKDGYVTVEWELTKRKGRYRYDYRRKFDVIPVPRPKPKTDEPKTDEAKTDEAKTESKSEETQSGAAKENASASGADGGTGP
jgi:hypothetical protein